MIAWNYTGHDRIQDDYIKDRIVYKKSQWWEQTEMNDDFV